MCAMNRILPALSLAVGLQLVAGAAPGPRPAAAPLDFSHVGVYGTCFDFCDYTVYKIVYLGKRRKPELLAHWRTRLHEMAAQGKRNLVGIYTFDRVKHSRPIPEYLAETDTVLEGIDLADVYAIFLSEENVTWSNGLAVLNALYDHIKSRYPELPVYQWLTSPVTPHPKLRADGWVYDCYKVGLPRFRRIAAKYVVTGKPFIMCLNASPDVGLFTDSWGGPVSQDQVEVCREFNIPMFFYCVDLKWGSPAIWQHSDAEEIVPWREWVLRVVEEAQKTDVSKLPMLTAQYSTGQPIEVAGDENNRFEFVDSFAAARFLDDATIRGFLNLRWDGEREVLFVERQAGAKDVAELIYHFASDFELSNITATLAGERLATGQGSAVELGVSVTGHNWPHMAAPGDGADGGPKGAFSLTASGKDDPEFKGRGMWVRVTAAPGQLPARTPAMLFDSLTVSCDVVPPERRAILLTPDRKGNVRYRDTFDSQKYLHLAHIDNAAELTWTRGRVGTHGVAGRGNRVQLRWECVAEKPLTGIVVRMDCSGNKRNLGAVTSLGVSLDGKNLLAQDDTADKPANKQGTFKGALTLDLTGNADFAGVSTFWVHGIMTNNCGAKTNRSNTIEQLDVDAKTVR